jgi:hypothetical protein
MNPQIKNLLALAAAAIIIILLARECNSMYQEKQNSVVDTIIQRVDFNEKKHLLTIDSLTEESAWDKIKIRALKIEKEELEKQLNASQIRAARLATAVKVAKTDNDTARYVMSCDSLSDEVAILNNEIDGYRQLNDYMVASNDSLVANQDKIIEQHKRMYFDLRAGFEEIVYEQKKTQVALNKAEKKNSRKYNVSVGAGYGLGMDLKPLPIVAVTINKTIFRF